MADYTASALLGAQAEFAKDFDKPELRRKQNPALMLALGNTDILIPGHQELRKKDNRPVKAYVKTKRAASNATAKSHNHTGTKADSAEVTLAWNRFVEPFKINLKQGQSNMFSYQKQLMHEIEESVRNIHDRAGTAALAYLQSNRNQVSGISTAGTGTWNATNFALEVDAANKEFFFQMVQSFMRKQLYRGGLDIILDQTQFRNYNRIGAQGSGNAVNTAFQISGMNAVETTEEIDANYTLGSGLVMPSNSFGGLVWNDPVNMQGKGDFDSVLGGYSTFADPFGSGMRFDLHGYTERADGSSTGGGVQDETLYMELSLCIAWVLPPLTESDASVVFEVAQAA